MQKITTRLKNLTCFTPKRFSGFTLLELLVVFTIIGIISTVSIASFVSYSRGATLKQAELDVSSLLHDAKSRAQSQRKPVSCTGTLQGYRVDICGLSGSSCQTPNTFTLSVVCTNATTLITTKQLPTNVSFISSSSSSSSFTFQTVTNGVIGAGSVILSGTDGQKAITVEQSGVISKE